MFVGCVGGSDLIRSAFSSPSLPQNQPELLYNRLCSAFLISTGFFFSFSLLYSLFLLFCFRSTNYLHITSIYLILPDIYYCLPCFPPNLLFSFSIRSISFFCPVFFSIFYNLARHLYSIYHSMAWLSKYTMGSWDQVSEMRKWCLGPPPPPHPLFPLLCSQWNWPDSAQDMAPAFFNQERNCWHVDTFLSKFWRWIRGRWGFLTLCIVPFSHHSYLYSRMPHPSRPSGLQ